VVWIFGILCFILIIILVFGAKQLIKFAKIIMIFEDDLSDAIQALISSHNTMENLLKMPLFFDSKEVKEATQEALRDVKLAKMAITGLIRKFTERSKQKYVTVKVVRREREEEIEDDDDQRFEEQ
jgi:hypothetical protein